MPGCNEVLWNTLEKNSHLFLTYHTPIFCWKVVQVVKKLSEKCKKDKFLNIKFVAQMDCNFSVTVNCIEKMIFQNVFAVFNN